MTVPPKHYVFSPFSPEANYSSHSLLCSELPPIYLYPSAAELTNGTEFFFLRGSPKTRRTVSPVCCDLVFYCALSHTLCLFSVTGSHYKYKRVLLPTTLPPFLQPALQDFSGPLRVCFRHSFCRWGYTFSNWISTSVLPVLSAILYLEASLNYFCIW